MRGLEGYSGQLLMSEWRERREFKVTYHPLMRTRPIAIQSDDIVSWDQAPNIIKAGVAYDSDSSLVSKCYRRARATTDQGSGQARIAPELALIKRLTRSNTRGRLRYCRARHLMLWPERERHRLRGTGFPEAVRPGEHSLIGRSARPRTSRSASTFLVHDSTACQPGVYIYGQTKKKEKQSGIHTRSTTCQSTVPSKIQIRYRCW